METDPIKPSRTFEECYEEISAIVEKKRREWTFKSSVMLDFEDVKIQILTHIWKKWDQYDQIRPLAAWVAKIVRNKFTNALRDVYLSTSSPCTQCACSFGESGCELFGEQGVQCPIYKKWYKKKRFYNDARLPLPLEHRESEAFTLPDHRVDLEQAMENLHKRLEGMLTDSEWRIYKKYYIENKSQEEIAQELGFKTSERGRKVGYKRIKQVQNKSLKLAREIIKDHGLEYNKW
jgi:RNA polymerase sigma factor (sigma-70 family)